VNVLGMSFLIKGNTLFRAHVPARHWFALRERFKKTIPKTVTATCLGSALGMAEISASTNVMPGLRTAGLIGDDGTPTELAIKWRDDAHYKETCEAIRMKVYPQELRDLAPPETATFDEVKTWFARVGGIGDSASGKAASFYMLLCDGNPQAGAAKQDNGKPRAARSPTQKAKPAKPLKTSKEDTEAKNAGNDGTGSPRRPTLSLNLQILVSPDATPEQIDKIFESMAKHLKEFG
jgi:hypothetical protein